VYFSSSTDRSRKRHMDRRFSLIFFGIIIFCEKCRSSNPRITGKVRGNACSYRCCHLYLFLTDVLRQSK
jgi:hypothetical protein